jgi:Na+-translocating ferredoxin:NAD+ oxidoreductase RnfG subunit
MVRIPLLIEEIENSSKKEALPNISEAIGRRVQKIVQVEVKSIGDNVSKLLEEISPIIAKITETSPKITTISVSLAVGANGTVSLMGTIGTQSSVTSSLVITYKVN